MLLLRQSIETNFRKKIQQNSKSKWLQITFQRNILDVFEMFWHDSFWLEVGGWWDEDLYSNLSAVAQSQVKPSAIVVYFSI